MALKHKDLQDLNSLASTHESSIICTINKSHYIVVSLLFELKKFKNVIKYYVTKKMGNQLIILLMIEL